MERTLTRMREMSAKTGTYRRLAFPPERRLVLDTLSLGRDKPMMHGLVEVDVTCARQLLRAHRQASGQSLSFTAFILACLGRAVCAHPEVHALRDALGGLVLFEDVDASTIVEVDVEGRRFALAHVVRNIHLRGVAEISGELQTIQTAGLASLSPGLRGRTRLLLSVPGPLRRAAYRAVFAFPELVKRHIGTLLVSSVGMFGRGGWGFSAPGVHNLSIVIGGLVLRPPIPGTSNEAGPREVLCLTVSANHEVVDGAPVARFVRHATDLMESAELLRDAVAPST